MGAEKKNCHLYTLPETRERKSEVMLPSLLMTPTTITWELATESSTFKRVWVATAEFAPHVCTQLIVQEVGVKVGVGPTTEALHNPVARAAEADDQVNVLYAL
jgi:hypothetical protein